MLYFFFILFHSHLRRSHHRWKLIKCKEFFIQGRRQMFNEMTAVCKSLLNNAQRKIDDGAFADNKGMCKWGSVEKSRKKLQSILMLHQRENFTEPRLEIFGTNNASKICSCSHSQKVFYCSGPSLGNKWTEIGVEKDNVIRYPYSLPIIL